MTKETLIFDAYAAYLALVRGCAPSGWVVFDGPQPVFPTDQTFIVVGCQDTSSPGMVTAVDAGVQEWESLGAFSRMEMFTIWAELVAWDGGSDFTSLRASADAFLTALGAALRPPPAGTGDAMLNNTLNQGGVGTGWTLGLSVTRMQQVSDVEGCAIHVQFTLTCTARI